MDLPKISVGVVLYKNEHYLAHSIASLLEQQYPGQIEFLFRDQSPHAEAKLYLEKHFPDVFPHKIKVTTGNNLGHSGGHNALIRKMTGVYYICASNDMLYDPAAFRNLIDALEKHRSYAVAGSKSLQWNFKQQKKTDRIDSIGIGLSKSHYFFDIGQNEIDYGQYDGISEIFGASGALFAIRKSALDQIGMQNMQGETVYFDELFHYKNDIDFAYRLFLAGQRCLFVPSATVWHDRQLGGGVKTRSLLQLVRNRKSASRKMKTDSFFGQLLVLFKHGLNRNQSFSVRGAIIMRLLSQLTYACVFEPYLLTVVPKFLRIRKEFSWKHAKTPPPAAYRGLSEFFGQRIRFAPITQINTATCVILDFFKGKRVCENVASLLAQKTDFSVHIVVSDNSCDQKNAEILRSLTQNNHVQVIINHQNLGYPKGNNEGVAKAVGELLFIVNPDIVLPDKTTLQRMADYLKKHQDVAILGPSQRNPDGSYEKTARHFPTLLAQFSRRTALRHFWPFSQMVRHYEFVEMQMDKTQAVDWLQSSFWAVRKDMWDYLGGFDEYYHIFMSDVEMCRVAWKHGLKVVYLAEVQVEADGKRCSAGNIFDIFRKRLVRIHALDAGKYFFRHLFDLNPR